MLNDHYVLYMLGTGIGERYFTGKFNNYGDPVLTDDLDEALQFESAREGYAYANRKAATYRVVLKMRVGRRPTPVNLRKRAA